MVDFKGRLNNVQSGTAMVWHVYLNIRWFGPSGLTVSFILKVLKISTTSDFKMVIFDKIEFDRF